MPHGRVIALAGFMGTGKTTVGKRLAARLCWTFVDIDAVITSREGRSVEAIFATDGEAYFRAREREAVAEAAAGVDAVIATGGGAILDPESFDVLRRAALFVCLTADAETILRRTRGGQRPLLQGDREARVRTLLAERAAVYGRVPHQIDTSALSADQVVDRILALHQGRDSAREDG